MLHEAQVRLWWSPNCVSAANVSFSGGARNCTRNVTILKHQYRVSDHLGSSSRVAWSVAGIYDASCS